MENKKFAFSRMNYIIMAAGLAVLILGFILMSSDSEPYGFGVLGITIGPIVVVLGFIIEFAAILYTPKKP